jgi:poly-gamma-glutamate synthase PgsB/CapB
MQLLVFATLVLVVLGVLGLERYLHGRNRRRIPIVIHVNGTRGKSSVARLIAAGLREDGIVTWAKVTGTLPRLIDARGEDVPIVRHSSSSINEQRALVAAASGAGVEALVVECMALRPEYQRVAEDGLIQASIGVITNVRPDHLEVFGPDMRSMLSAFGSTIPRGKILFTAETRHTRPLSDEASRRGAEFVLASAESVDDATMARFAYHEHKDNVALALAVCRHLGVSRDVALDGMVGAQPDPGALTSIALRQGAKELVLVNAMAANDPQSTYQLYRELVEDESAGDRRVILANARRDRPGRTQQLADLLPRLTADQVFAIGDAAGELREMAIQRGLPRAQIATHGGSAEDLVTRLFGHPGRSSVVFAIGNIAGPGLALTNYFESNGRPTRAARLRPVVTLRAA